MDQDLRKPDASHGCQTPLKPETPRSPPVHHPTDPLNGTVRMLRRIATGIIGGTVLAVGVVMIVTPGPAVVVIPTGLAILAVEFEFARRWLRAAKERARHLASRSEATTRDEE